MPPHWGVALRKGTLVDKAIGLLNAISKLYLEFAYQSKSLRDYLYYQHLFNRTEDYIAQLHGVARQTGTTPTADETEEVISQIMRDFALSFRQDA